MRRTAHPSLALMRGGGLLALLFSLLAACATQTPKKEANAPADGRVASVPKNEAAGTGFTVKEIATADGDARRDFAEAVKLLEAEDYVKAIELLTKVTQREKGASAPYIDLAIAYEKTGKMAAAEESLKKALEINPDHPVANNEYGLLYRRTGRFAEARKSYEKVLAKYPGFLPARRNLAILCDLYMRDYDCALKNYQLYGQSLPNDKEVRIWLADLRQRMGH